MEDFVSSCNHSMTSFGRLDDFEGEIKTLSAFDEFHRYLNAQTNEFNFDSK